MIIFRVFCCGMTLCNAHTSKFLFSTVHLQDYHSFRRHFYVSFHVPVNCELRRLSTNITRPLLHIRYCLYHNRSFPSRKRLCYFWWGSPFLATSVLCVRRNCDTCQRISFCLMYRADSNSQSYVKIRDKVPAEHVTRIPTHTPSNAQVTVPFALK